MKPLFLDIATMPIDGVSVYLDEPTAPANYKDPEKIAAYIAEAKASAESKAALDPDLGRIAAIGYQVPGEETQVILCATEAEERNALLYLAGTFLDLTSVSYRHLVGYNSLKFDWPFLLRRAAYLDVPLSFSLDRYKTPHVDLAEKLTHRGLLPMRSLGFYVRRLGWMDLMKPLSGAEEALAPSQGRWEELEASVRHDVEATARLAAWLGVVARPIVRRDAPLFAEVVGGPDGVR